ncbi:metalloregulator ArsR/SmtB family transcription factor (plasmid) [Mesorhizobium sp. AR02]|uniref:ArsR/SmtB family transcription factor n=1 Tax=Mesorhizobium sp. AR02 TaxID=2865837 RepID=UPI002160B1A0|nr:metalloregulator ArsR/SmtB family transcription factor [Mesorhizobium sp. AR02]UVK57495.1 metalloregulator ArsR/SmtB family transcription factor [Mesorhizobium sp. AR02]
MVSYLRQRLQEIKADPALGQPPIKRQSLRSQAAVAARLLAVLGNGKRLLTIVHLMDRETTMGDLASRVGLSRPALSQHLSLLIAQGILECRTEGARRYYSCKSEEAKTIIRLLDDFANDDKVPNASTGAGG